MGFFKNLINNFLMTYSDDTAITKVKPICPECALEIERVTFDNITFFICNTCEGIWLSQDALAMIISANEFRIAPLLEQHQGSKHTHQRSSQGRVCPNCNATMDNYQFDYSSGIWIDACPNRHGIWLDSGELNLIRQFRSKIDEEFTAEEKVKIANAFLDSTTKTAQNFNKIEKEVRRQYASRHRNYQNLLPEIHGEDFP